ncbi:MAG: hypothetical protein WC523_02935 [Patescibacteria group bacterium]|jgi:maltodextrin utilization protein YvdJ
METKKEKEPWPLSLKVLLIILIYLILTIFASVYLAWITKKSGYMSYRDIKVTVVGHQIGEHNSLYLIVKNKEWGIFEIRVSPTTYNVRRNGDQTYFSLRESDIKQTLKKNLIYSEGQIILWGSFLLITLFLCFFALLSDIGSS